ncbi:MAG TPA: hypothetical protein GX002_07930 [Clostridiales bacterium]|nr:hypothetical protein [Clostridiales bacterium]
MERVLLHIVPAIAIGFIMQLIIHETGHLVGGLLTGWRFSYLQLYNLVLKKESKRLKRMVINDIGFKCIMYPISINNKALLYTIGGCIANLITGIIGLVILITAPLSPVMWLYIWCFLSFGIGLFFMNGTASIKRICNDKACYNLLRLDKHNILCHNAQLVIAKYLIRGLTYSDIGEELICLCPDMALNDIYAYQAVLEYYYYLDTNNYLKAGQALNKIQNNNISMEVLNIIKLERIYYQLLLIFMNFDSIQNSASDNNASISSIEESIIKYSKKGDIHSFRVKAVYEAFNLLSAGHSNKAIKYLNTSIYNMKKYKCIYDGEKRFCIKLLRRIINTIISYQNKND